MREQEGKGKRQKDSGGRWLMKRYCVGRPLEQEKRLMGVDDQRLIECEKERLQEEINVALQQEPLAASVSIRLPKWSPVIELTLHAFAMVAVAERAVREFTIISQADVCAMFGPEWDILNGKHISDRQDVYCSGGPLIIVKQISGETIVRGVINFLSIEGVEPSFQRPN